MDKTIRHVCSGPRLKYEVLWYGYNSADELPSYPSTYKDTSSTLIGIDSTRDGSLKSFRELAKVL